MSEITDEKRAIFLLDLDDSEKVTVSDFEAKFVESNMERINRFGIKGVKFSDKQRSMIDGMMDKYKPKL